MKKFFIVALLAMVFAVSLTSCVDDGVIVRSNLEREEQNFRVYRRVVFYNVITGNYILKMEGYMAIITDEDKDVVVTVKLRNGEYMKHYLGHADNVTYFSEALEPSAVSDDRFKVTFKPTAIAPTVESR